MRAGHAPGAPGDRRDPGLAAAAACAQARGSPAEGSARPAAAGDRQPAGDAAADRTARCSVNAAGRDDRPLLPAHAHGAAAEPDRSGLDRRVGAVGAGNAGVSAVHARPVDTSTIERTTAAHAAPTWSQLRHAAVLPLRGPLALSTRHAVAWTDPFATEDTRCAHDSSITWYGSTCSAFRADPTQIAARNANSSARHARTVGIRRAAGL